MDAGAFPGMAGNAHIIGRAINQLDSLLYIVKSDTVGGIRTVGVLQLFFQRLQFFGRHTLTVIRNINVETVVLPGIQGQPDLPVAGEAGEEFCRRKGKNCPVSCRYN